MSRLDGKAAFVTGAGRGIGQGIALALAREGATVAIVDIAAEQAEQAAREINDAVDGARAVAHACDIADRAAVFATMERFVAHAGGLDILVNNAVYFHYAPLPDMPEEVVHRMIDVGIKGTIWVSQAATRHLIARAGCVVNLSSVAVSFGIRNAAVYTSIKGALDALTRQQAVELAPHKVRVNAIAPGPVETPGASTVIDRAGWEARRNKTPIGRLATTDELGAAVVYLASDDARSVTGVTLKIDGGITLVGP
jgi:NAD(P)-dependent dehydrogenase (short-subunit alcohol dehydrogenase family)